MRDHRTSGIITAKDDACGSIGKCGSVRGPACAELDAQETFLLRGRRSRRVHFVLAGGLVDACQKLEVRCGGGPGGYWGFRFGHDGNIHCNCGRNAGRVCYDSQVSWLDEICVSCGVCCTTLSIEPAHLGIIADPARI